MVRLAYVKNTDVNEWQSVRLVRFECNNRFSPGIGARLQIVKGFWDKSLVTGKLGLLVWTYFTLVFDNFILESLLAHGIELNIVPAKDLHGFFKRPIVSIVIGNRVAAMVSQILASVGR